MIEIKIILPKDISLYESQNFQTINLNETSS